MKVLHLNIVGYYTVDPERFYPILTSFKIPITIIENSDNISARHLTTLLAGHLQIKEIVGTKKENFKNWSFKTWGHFWQLSKLDRKQRTKMKHKNIANKAEKERESGGIHIQIFVSIYEYVLIWKLWGLKGLEWKNVN